MTTFARLLCVSKTLQTALESAAVGCLAVDLTLSTSGSPARFIYEPEYPTFILQQQLAWVAKHLQQGHIRQLRLYGLSARSIQWQGCGSESAAAMALLEQLWADISSKHSACFRSCADDCDFYTSCSEHMACMAFTFALDMIAALACPFLRPLVAE